MLLEAVVPLPYALLCSLLPFSAVIIPLWAVAAVIPCDACNVCDVEALTRLSTNLM